MVIEAAQAEREDAPRKIGAPRLGRFGKGRPRREGHGKELRKVIFATAWQYPPKGADEKRSLFVGKSAHYA